jgi:predicted dehydrogenase
LFKDAYLAELEHFVACVQEDRAPAVTGEDGQRAVEAVRAVNDSIRTGQPVSICQEALQ